MLPPARRVRRSDDFRHCVRRGARGSSPSLTVHLRVVDSPPTDPARAGFVVSKAVGNAVVRNRVTRQLRHLVGPRLEALPAGSMLVVRAQPAAAGAGSDLLARDLDDALGVAVRRTHRAKAGPS